MILYAVAAIKNAKKKCTKLSPACVYAQGSTFLKSHTTKKADKIY